MAYLTNGNVLMLMEMLFLINEKMFRKDECH